MGSNNGRWNFLNIPLIFAGKMPAKANKILYKISWVQEDETRARIVDPAEKKNHGCSTD
jgi:hypothetical protein